MCTCLRSTILAMHSQKKTRSVTGQPDPPKDAYQAGQPASQLCTLGCLPSRRFQADLLYLLSLDVCCLQLCKNCTRRPLASITRGFSILIALRYDSSVHDPLSQEPIPLSNSPRTIVAQVYSKLPSDILDAKNVMFQEMLKNLACTERVL